MRRSAAGILSMAALQLLTLSWAGTARATCCNTKFGNVALGSDTTGDFNSAFGFVALGRNTTGQFNTAVGSQILGSITGYNNTAVGYLSLNGNGNDVGSNNTAVGSSALSLNTSVNNTAVGFEALQNNTTGFDNTASGVDALSSNTTGVQNTATPDCGPRLVPRSGFSFWVRGLRHPAARRKNPPRTKRPLLSQREARV